MIVEFDEVFPQRPVREDPGCWSATGVPRCRRFGRNCFCGITSAAQTRLREAHVKCDLIQSERSQDIARIELTVLIGGQRLLRLVMLQQLPDLLPLRRVPAESLQLGFRRLRCVCDFELEVRRLVRDQRNRLERAEDASPWWFLAHAANGWPRLLRAILFHTCQRKRIATAIRCRVLGAFGQFFYAGGNVHIELIQVQ